MFNYEQVVRETLSRCDKCAIVNGLDHCTMRFYKHLSINQSHYDCKMCSILEINSNQRFRDKKTKLNICYHMLTSSIQLQNGSFLIVTE